MNLGLDNIYLRDNANRMLFTIDDDQSLYSPFSDKLGQLH